MSPWKTFQPMSPNRYGQSRYPLSCIVQQRWTDPRLWQHAWRSQPKSIPCDSACWQLVVPWAYDCISKVNFTIRG